MIDPTVLATMFCLMCYTRNFIRHRTRRVVKQPLNQQTACQTSVEAADHQRHVDCDRHSGHWAGIHLLAADYFMTLSERFRIAPDDAHVMFLLAVDRYLLIASAIGFLVAMLMSL